MGVASDTVRGKRVAVLCGGPSAEREVSVASGRAVHQALRGAGLSSTLVVLEGADLAEMAGLEVEIVFNALHGAFGEDGTVQRLLAARGLPYTGSRPDACALAFDKAEAKRVFHERGVPTPPWLTLTESDGQAAALVTETLRLPVAVKPVRGGSSQGVSLVTGIDELGPALGAALGYDDRAMVETLVRGRELTVGVLEGEALPVVELRTPRAFYDYEAKYRDEQTEYLCPAELPAEAEAATRQAALEACGWLGAEHVARVDLILDENDRPWVLEVNIIPGLTDHSLLPKAAAAAGIAFPDLCIRLLELAWRRDVESRER
jgi:D-alanine-D-alanine ligase